MSKSVKQLSLEYSQLDLYKQGTAGRLLYLSYPWVPCFEITVNHRRTAVVIDRLLAYLEGDLFVGWWSKKGMEQVARFYFNKNLQNSNFIHNLKNHWHNRDLADVMALVKKIEKTDLAVLSKTELLRLFYAFSRVYSASWRETIFLDSFDVMGEPLLEEILNKHGAHLKAEDLHIATSVTKLSSLQMEKKKLLNLAISVLKNRKLKQAIVGKNTASSLARNFPIFFRRIQKHAQDYHWIYNDYAVLKRMDEKFFLHIIRSWLLKSDDFNKQSKDIAAVAKLKAERQKLMQKKRFPRSMARTIDLMVVLSEWRDLRKMHCQMANSAIRLLATEFARRNTVPIAKIENLFWWELPQLFTRQKKALIAIATQRYRGSFFEGRLDTDPIHFGRAARKLRDAADHPIQEGIDLAGRTAFAGHATGRVKIVLTQSSLSSFKKMKRGDILVAHNTRPEYVPVMRLAGAIITEEGGITSHASIVSRELKVPCVVGVQGATLVLKDGDRVEVDAFKGIVRKI